VLTRLHAAGIAEGLNDDSAELDELIIAGLRSEMGTERKRMADAALAAMEPPVMRHTSVEESADQLDRDARAISGMMAAQAIADPQALLAQLTEPVRGRRSIPMSAPVSREVPDMNGKKVANLNQVTLSSEERAIARNSFGPIKGTDGLMHDLTDAQKELLFAKNKQKMLAMRAAGQLNE
jgi:phage terminase small subunit